MGQYFFVKEILTHFIINNFWKICYAIMQIIKPKNIMKSETEPPILWNKKETAIYLRKSVRTISRLVKNGRIKSFKAGVNGGVLIYAETVTEENLNSIKPKFI